MKVRALAFLVISKAGKETFHCRTELDIRLSELHRLGYMPFPKVLVTDIPGQKKPKWLKYNEYKKLLKEEKHA